MMCVEGSTYSLDSMLAYLVATYLPARVVESMDAVWVCMYVTGVMFTSLIVVVLLRPSRAPC